MNRSLPKSGTARWRRSEARSTATQVFACTAAVILASSGYSAFFVSDTFLLPVAGAAVLGAACAGLMRYWRRPLGAAAAVSATAFLIYLVYTLFSDHLQAGLPGPGAVTAAADGILHGLARMLSAPPPAAPTAELSTLPTTLAFAAVLASVLLLSTRNALLPVLPALLAFVASALLSASPGGLRVLQTVGVLVCGLVVVLLRAGRQTGGVLPISTAPIGQRPLNQPTKAGRVLFGLPVTAVIVTGAMLGSLVLPVATGANRFDPRQHSEFPVDVNAQLNPLLNVRRQLSAPVATPVLTVRVDDAAPLPDNRLRVAALDTYDGVQWSSAARFKISGPLFSSGPALLEPSTIGLSLDLASDTTLPYLPALGRPLSSDCPELGFDDQSGMLITSYRGESHLRYHLTAEISGEAGNTDAALPSQGPEFAALLAQPPDGGNADAGLSELANFLTAGHDTPIAQLSALVQYLRAFRYGSDAPPGHSYAALARLLPDAGAETDRRVTEEQSVSAFVLMSRSLGYPARVAVGYRVPARPDPDGAYRVTTADADAWAEVSFAGVGWVPFDPTPTRAGAPPPPPTRGDAFNPGGAPELKRPDGTGPDIAETHESSAGLPTWLFVAVLITLCLCVAAAAMAVVRVARRWHRRCTGTTRDRVTGAWRESTRRLRRHGVITVLSRTPEEVARDTEVKVGSEAARATVELAQMVSAAWFARHPPDESMGHAAWAAEARLRSILHKTLGWPRRGFRPLDPRRLQPRRVGTGHAMPPRLGLGPRRFLTRAVSSHERRRSA